MFTPEGYESVQKKITRMSVEEIVADFESRVGSRSCTSIRGVVDSLMVESLIEMGVDIFAFYDGTTISFAKYIKLSDDKTKVVTI